MLFNICTSLSAGIVIGFVLGGMKLLVKEKYTERQNKLLKKIIDRASGVLKYTTFLLLALGLVWCLFFLILGTLVPEQTDYANNMAELIVSVLTVISIIFAFVEFSKRAGKKEEVSDRAGVDPEADN